MTHEQNFHQAEETLQWVIARNATHRDALRQLALLCSHLNRTNEVFFSFLFFVKNVVVVVDVVFLLPFRMTNALFIVFFCFCRLLIIFCEH